VMVALSSYGPPPPVARRLPPWVDWTSALTLPVMSSQAGAVRRGTHGQDPSSKTVSTLVSGPHAYSVSRFVTFDACAARRFTWAHPNRPPVAPRSAGTPRRVRLLLPRTSPRGRATATAAAPASAADDSAPRRLSRT